MIVKTLNEEINKSMPKKANIHISTIYYKHIKHTKIYKYLYSKESVEVQKIICNKLIERKFKNKKK